MPAAAVADKVVERSGVWLRHFKMDDGANGIGGVLARSQPWKAWALGCPQVRGRVHAGAPGR
ncbi:hypothetical protein N7519_011367 [Penicillium mononematosum]|uniref:uncharacterized protein n=1 Tax=Penicillium mononematosum TaxID=268346 RepID=UPI002546C0DB|nr:uncharacterized protein N7519_011367 [Penicillium mononematosum]KAJ6180906.1 hypothetical protein N7519_011367 [Penicillium mononematosum]